MAMFPSEYGVQSSVPTSGCQLLPGLCISVFDGEFEAQGDGVYRVQPHGDQVLDVLVGHFSGWDTTRQPLPDSAQLFGDALALERQPQEIIERIQAQALACGMPPGARLSVLCLRIDMQQGRLTWVGCGAPSSIVYRQGAEPRSLSPQQQALGDVAIAIRQDSLDWQSGDALFLGVASGNALDARRMEEAMSRQRGLHATPAMALHGLRAAWLSKAADQPSGVLLLLLQRHEAGVDLDRLELPVTLDILTPLREFVSRHAQRSGLSEEREAGLILAVVEVVTNVIRHAQGLLAQAPIEIVVEHLDHDLVLTIRYIGQAYMPGLYAQVHDLSTYPEGGFGHYIIEQTCDEVHYGHHAGVNLVRLRISTRHVDPV